MFRIPPPQWPPAFAGIGACLDGLGAPRRVLHAGERPRGAATMAAAATGDVWVGTTATAGAVPRGVDSPCVSGPDDDRINALQDALRRCRGSQAVLACLARPEFADALAATPFLDLSRCRLGNRGTAAVVAALATRCPRLALLSLAHNGIGDAELPALGLQRLTRLVVLDLAGNRLGDGLAALALPAGLEALNLAGNRRALGGVAPLPTWPPALRFLIATQTACTDAEACGIAPDGVVEVSTHLRAGDSAAPADAHIAHGVLRRAAPGVDVAAQQRLDALFMAPAAAADVDHAHERLAPVAAAVVGIIGTLACVGAAVGLALAAGCGLALPALACAAAGGLLVGIVWAAHAGSDGTRIARLFTTSSLHESHRARRRQAPPWSVGHLRAIRDGAVPTFPVRRAARVHYAARALLGASIGTAAGVAGMVLVNILPPLCGTLTVSAAIWLGAASLATGPTTLGTVLCAVAAWIGVQVGTVAYEGLHQWLGRASAVGAAPGERTAWAEVPGGSAERWADWVDAPMRWVFRAGVRVV